MRNSLITRKRLSRVALATGAASFAVALAACGGGASADTSTEAEGGGGAPEVTELLVGIVPVLDHASVFVAIDQGFFEEEGLNVTAQPAQGGAAAVPAMIQGDMQAAFATYPSFLLAQNAGNPVTIMAEGVRGTEEYSGVFATAESGIESVEDLAGKTVAVNTLNNTGDQIIKSQLQAADVDLADVEFKELPFPDMVSTVQDPNSGVDAVWLVEPYTSAANAAGLHLVTPTFTGDTEGMPLSGVAMMASFVEENPNTAAAFARALEKANEVLADDPSVAADLLPTYSQVKADVASTLILPQWTAGGPDASEINRWNDIMTGTGALPQAVDVEAMIYGG